MARGAGRRIGRARHRGRFRRSNFVRRRQLNPVQMGLDQIVGRSGRSQVSRIVEISRQVARWLEPGQVVRGQLEWDQAKLEQVQLELELMLVAMELPQHSQEQIQLRAPRPHKLRHQYQPIRSHQRTRSSFLAVPSRLRQAMCRW